MDAAGTRRLDGAGVNCGMARLHGRAPSGGRVNDYVPSVRFGRTSVVGAPGLEGIVAPLAHKGALNGEFFALYAKECLAPATEKGGALILGNLSAHKVAGATRPPADKGVDVVCLPAHSQDFNPMERA